MQLLFLLRSGFARSLKGTTTLVRARRRADAGMSNGEDRLVAKG
jgi:hypothetical protein